MIKEEVMKKKYKLTKETKEHNGHTLHRIEALEDFGFVAKGDLGGWIEKERNLSHDGNAWVGGDAEVYGNAWIYGYARVSDNARVYGNARVYDNAWVSDNARVSDNAEVYDNAWVSDNAEVYGNARVYDNAWIYGYARVSSGNDYIVFKNWWSSGRFFTWTRSNNMWRVGCFYGTAEELIKKAHAGSEKSGREYERIVRYVESILRDEENENNSKEPNDDISKTKRSQ